MKILCALGKNQYGDPTRGLGVEYAAFIPALKNLGHEIYHFELWDRKQYRDYFDLNLKLLNTVKQYQPDILVTVPMNYEIWMETLIQIKAHRQTISVCWTTDDSWKYKQVSRFIGKAYDIITTTYPEVLPLYRKDGIEHVFLTQWAASSQALRTPINARDCKYPVTFVGAAHGNRKKRVNELRRAGIGVKCFGYGWPESVVSSATVPKIMQESAISLNFANSKGRNQVKARTFEVPGAGGFLLTEQAPGIEKYYTPGEEVEIFGDTNELIEKIEYYLKNTGKRDEIAWAGNRRTAEEHTYENRFKEILQTAQLYKTIGSITYFDFQDQILTESLKRYRCNPSLKILRKILVCVCKVLFGKRRGVQVARRLVFEISWRLFGEKTFTAAGWPARMFPEI